MSVLLEIKDLYKNFSGIEVIRGFNLSLNEHTLSCLVGPNGAGKSTTIDLITGRLKATSGTISFKNSDYDAMRDITGMNESVIAHMGISRKFQVPAVFKELTVRQNLEVAFSTVVSPFKNMLKFSSSEFSLGLMKFWSLTGLGQRLSIVARNLVARRNSGLSWYGSNEEAKIDSLRRASSWHDRGRSRKNGSNAQ